MNTSETAKNQDSAAAELFTKAEAAAYLKMKVRTLDHWREQKALPCIQHRRYIRFRRADLEAFLAAHTVGAGVPAATATDCGGDDGNNG